MVLRGQAYHANQLFGLFPSFKGIYQLLVSLLSRPLNILRSDSDSEKHWSYVTPLFTPSVALWG